MILPKVNLNIERWKWNADYGVYVSNMGNFKRSDKKDLPKKIWNGYHSVYTCCGWRPAHRLVALTWLPIPDAENLTVDHKDSNRRNNRVDNLEWVTEKENLTRAENNLLSKNDIDDSTLKHYPSRQTVKIHNVPSYKIMKDKEVDINYKYTFTKADINITFNNLLEAIHFIRVMYGDIAKPKVIANNIINSATSNTKYMKGKWSREEIVCQ